MSALLPKADKPQTSHYVRFVPKADKCAAANDNLLDHLVGDGEHDMPTTLYGPATGPKSGGGIRCFVPASYAEAIRKRIGSENGFPINIIPTGSFAGTGPARRVPSGAVASRTRSYT